MQCQATALKPAQPDHKFPGLPDISLLSPELQQQWHVQRNMHLGAIMVKPNSSIKVVWQCNQCPAGQPHIWTAAVNQRAQRGTKCPCCCNRIVCLHNSLATIAPDIAQSWNHRKNEKAPEQVVTNASYRAEWKCPTCSWEWQAPVFSRTRKRAGCPKCSARTKQSQPTFADAQPAELSQWDFERNDARGLYPDKITLGSNRMVHWICSCCPRGQPHRWTAPPYNRIGRGAGCAACAGQQVCICNSLESLFPSIAAEFDVAQNGFAPSDITAHSHKEVWWTNAKRGTWKQSVNGREKKGTAVRGCLQL